MMRLLGLFSILLLTACTSIGFFLANAPVAEADLSIQKDVAYGNAPYQKLDIYTPKNGATNKTIVFYFGGGWKQGSKNDYLFVAAYLVNQGYNVVVPDYGLYPNVTYPQFLQDSALAADWAYRNLPHTQFHLMGHSAGAYNAAMIAVNDTYLAPHRLDTSNITSVIGISGPYEFIPSSTKYRAIFGNMEDYSEIKISQYISGNEPPFLIMHGKDDSTVTIRHSKKFADNLRKAGISVDTAFYNDMGHYKIIGAFAPYLLDRYTISQDVADYLGKTQ